jgi:hypothetical protein
LDAPSISLTSAAGAADIPVEDVVAAVSAAASAGWGSVHGEQFEVDISSRAYLREVAGAMTGDDVRLMIERIAAAVTNVATSVVAGVEVMTHGLRTDVLSVVRAATRHGHPRVAARIAQAAWPTVTAESTSGSTSAVSVEWCRGLAEGGEDAAIAGREPELLVDLFDRSARVYSDRRDWQAAERALLRALFMVEQLGDTARFAHYLKLLATNYTAWGRLHKTGDMLLELVAVREREGDSVAAAEALASIGTTMFDAGQLDVAIDYLGRAERLLRDLPDAAMDAQTHRAVILADLGRAHAQRGALNSARNSYHQALALALRIGDDTAAERIRGLQAALPSA